MKMIKTLLWLGGAYLLVREIGRAFGSSLFHGAFPLGTIDDEDVADLTGPPTLRDLPVVGIADVDPEPLSSPLEAVDPEATRAAHEDIPAQRARLPR